MIIAYVFLALLLLFVLEVLNSLRDFDLADAHIVQHINISNSLPKIQTTTLTGSIRRRLNDFYDDTDLMIEGTGRVDKPFLEPEVKMFYQKYMKEHIGKLSKTFLYHNMDSTIRLLAINPEWNRYRTYSNLAFYTLKDETLYDINSKRAIEKTWKHCFYQYIDGTIETATYDKNYDKFAAAFHNSDKKDRFIVYYNDLKCKDSENIPISDFHSVYCDDFENKLCNNVNATTKHEDDDSQRWAVYPRNLLQGLIDDNALEMESNPSYDYIPIDDKSTIVNMAVAENLVVYTTLDDKMKIKYVFRDNEGDWIQNELEYPVVFQKYRIHQNLGVGFISNSLINEKQIMIVDLIATEEKVQLVYLIYKFVFGSTIIKDEQLLDIYKFNSTEDIEHDMLYGSVMYELKRINITEELSGLDVLQGLSLPKSIIKSQPRTNQTVIVSLQKYALQIKMEDENDVYSTHLISIPEDQSYKIKNFDISDDGSYIVFLTHSKNKIKIFISHATINPVGGEQETLYLVKFNYPLDFEEKTVKEIQLIKNEENEQLLMLILESGEVATFSIQFGTMSFERLTSSFMGEDLELFSILSLLAVIFIFCFIKLTNNTRFQIYLRPPPR